MIDQRIKDGKPLTVTFHGYMDVNGKPPTGQWFQAMTDILDYLKSKGDRVKLITYSQLVDLYFPPKR